MRKSKTSFVAKVFKNELEENIVFRDLTNTEVNLFSFLYFAGYLKHEQLFLVNNKLHGNLLIPNEEVRLFYEDVVQSWIQRSPVKHNALDRLLTALLKGDIRLFERLFSDFVRDTLSYFDTAKIM